MDSDKEEIVPIVATQKKNARKRPSTSAQGPFTSSATDTLVKTKRKSRILSPENPVPSTLVQAPDIPVSSTLSQANPEPVNPAETAVLLQPVLPPTLPVAPVAPRPPISPLTCDVLKPCTIYYDLGYVVSDINFAIPETMWRTKICSFSFRLDPDAMPYEQMFDLTNLTSHATNSTHNKMTHFVDLTHFRLVCTDLDDMGLLLVPEENAHALGRCIEGTVQFNGNRSEAVDALRHYLPVSVRDNLKDDVKLPPLPVLDYTRSFQDGWRLIYGFMLGGKPYRSEAMPRMRLGLTKSEEVYLVGKVDIPNTQIIVDVYLAENFFAAQGKEEFTEEALGRHDIQQAKRIQFLLEMGKAIVVKDNPLLEMLLVEKGYVPGRRVDQVKLLGDHIDPKDVISLFRHVREAHADQTILITHNPQHPKLKLKMRAYQKRAVSWMITREFAILKDLSYPHPLYFPVETFDGHRFFMHAYTGRLSETHPSVKAARGGILADEMGLGKTLEIISLVLSNPSPLLKPKNPDGMLIGKQAEPIALQCYCESEARSSSKPRPTISCFSCGSTQHKDCAKYDLLPKQVKFLCSKCQRDHPVECKTTLVVAPAAIIRQWQTEISKSAKDLKVIEYKGVASAGYVSPWELALCDIVLASYEMLSREIVFLHAEVRKESLRTNSKRVVIRSPLLAISFRRFVLDEAQMVESQTANYAQMAMKIKAHFYWAVTGTPIQRSVADLQSLFSFIELSPWTQPKWFNEYITGPFKAGIKEPLQDTLGECMWRLEKSSVEDEMDLPPCTIIVHKLTFSGIEMQLYQQVYRDCIKVVTGKLRQKRYQRQGVDIYSRKVSDLDGDLVGTLKTWMAHLEKLCTSPTRVKYFFKELRKKDDEEPTSDDMDSLKRVVKTLLEKARLEITHTLRNCMMTRSGAAGIYWLMARFPKAAEMYRDAKRLWIDNERFVHVDIGQKLHILTSLGQLIAEHRQEIPPTLEDDELLDRANDLKAEFLGRNASFREKANTEVREAWLTTDRNGRRTEVRHDGKTLEKAIMPVYAALRCIGDCAEDEIELVQQCKLSALEDLCTVSKVKCGRSRAMNATYQNLDGLKLVLQERWSTILKERTAIMQQVEKMIDHNVKDGDSFVMQCAACHMRTEVSMKRCRLCLLESTFTAYEDLIFRTVVTSSNDEDDDALTSRQQKLKETTENFENDQRDSTWAESDFEKVSKAIATYLRTKRDAKNDRGGEKKYAQEYLRYEAEWKQFQLVIDLLKKEHKGWRALWRTVYNEASSCDELRQSVMRVRFATEDEMAVANSLTKPKKREFLDSRCLVDPAADDLPIRLRNSEAQYEVFAMRLKGDISRYTYVQNMHDSYVNESGAQERECCICYDPVGQDNWALFPCAHVICRTCLKALEKNTLFSRQPQCPECRTTASSGEILQANTTRRPTLSSQKVQRFDTLRLKGAPQKMKAVVREVFRINIEEPDAKILILSDCTDVLDDYMWVLRRNGVSAIHVKTKALIPNCIEKLRSGAVRILLMPISMGGKGLTITEATHLFFLEPIMNKGAELQAIGRIHRMGQTKPTFVHKFIVQQTIEEQIHKIMSSLGEEGNLLQEDLTLRRILDLLKSAGFEGPDAEDADIWNIQPETIPINRGVDENQPSTSGL